MNFEAVGKLYKKFDAVQVSERFQKRELVLEIQDGAYPQFVKFQMTQDRCSALDPFNVGDMIKVSFNLKGREYTNQKGEIIYFTNLDAWRVESNATTQANTVPSQPSGMEETFPTMDDAPTSASTTTDFEDDLPF